MNQPNVITLLADLEHIVTDPRATDDMRRAAITLAYDIGKSEGHTAGVLAGIERMHRGAQDALDLAIKRGKSQ